MSGSAVSGFLEILGRMEQDILERLRAADPGNLEAFISLKAEAVVINALKKDLVSKQNKVNK